MILVTGATGNVGSEVVLALAAANEPVRALVRKREAASFPAAVESVEGDLDQPESLRAALEGVRSVFLLGGFRDMPNVMVELQKAGVRQVVGLSSRSIIGGNPDNAVVRRWRGFEDALESSGVPFTLLRPSGFASNALRWRAQLAQGDVVRAPFANAPIASIDPYDIAAVARVALTQPGHDSKRYALSGPKAERPAEQVATLGRVLDRNLRCVALSDEEARKELEKSTPPEIIDAFFRFFVEGEFDDSVVLSSVEDLTGQPPRTFEQWARAHAAAFR
jgi:uncharacterized protein YbjT (DUF2867 family)